VLGLLLLGGGLRAQDTAEAGGPGPATATRATPEMIEAALDALKVQHTKVPGAYVFKLGDRQMELHVLPKGERLLVKTTVGGTDPSLEVLNRYNEKMAITTRAVRYAKEGVVLEAGLDCRLGVSANSVRHFLSGFAQDLREFEQFLAKAGGQAPATGAPGTGAPGTGAPSTGAPASGAPGTGAPKGGGTGQVERPVIDRVPGADNPPVTGQLAPKAGPLPLKITPGSDDKELEVHFPTKDAGDGETAWKIVWDMQTGKEANAEGFKFNGRTNTPVLFRVKQAYYRPGPKAEWLQVLEDVHPSEFYVPYFFQNTRFFDLRDVGGYVPLLEREAGPRGKLLGKDKRVMAELRDRGVVYKHGGLSRRGEELVLWGNFQAGNYTYLIEFCFHDDGTVALKHAPTGYNFFAHFDAGSHMHNCLWRIGVKLAPVGSKANNQVSLIKLPYDPKQLGQSGKLDITPIASESYHDYDAKEFTHLRVTNPDFSNFPDGGAVKLPISYDLVPSIQGQARHYRNKDEGFSMHDFWVTRPDCPEKMYIYLPQYFGKQNAPVSLAGGDGVVLWNMSSALHVPRGEDGVLYGNNLTNGQALVRWTSVELRPRNLSIKTPLYQIKK
jgi:hypothetical protein